MMLEAKGYNVSIVEYISPLETPKNLMIKATKTSKENLNYSRIYKFMYRIINPALLRFYMNNGK